MSWVISKPVSGNVVYYAGGPSDPWSGQMEHAIRFDRRTDAQVFAAVLDVDGLMLVEYRHDCGAAPKLKEVVTLAFLEVADLDVVTNALIGTGRWQPSPSYPQNGGYRREMVRQR